MKVNLRYGSTMLAGSLISSLLLARCIPHLSFVRELVFMNDDFYLTPERAWQLWRGDVIALLIFTALAFFTQRGSARSLMLIGTAPVAGLLCLSALVQFVATGQAGFYSGFYPALCAGLLLSQVWCVISMLDVSLRGLKAQDAALYDDKRTTN